MKNTLEPSNKETLSYEETCEIGRIPDKENPLLIDEKNQISRYRYKTIHAMFMNNNWSMRQYLEYYNNLDTLPFLESLRNFTQYYIDRGVDVFKEAISGN